MIGTGEESLIGLSLRTTLDSPLDSPNTGLTRIILCMSLGTPLGTLIEYICCIKVPKHGYGVATKILSEVIGLQKSDYIR